MLKYFFIFLSLSLSSSIAGQLPEMVIGQERIDPGINLIFEGAIKDDVFPSSNFVPKENSDVHLKVNVDEEDYGAYLNWLTHADATLTFPQTVFIRYTLQEPGVADAAAEGYKRWFVARLKLLEATLNDREYLCSDRFTIADICVSYAIYLAGTLGIEQAFKPNIKRWTDMLFEREAFKKIIEYKYDGPGPSGPSEL